MYKIDLIAVGKLKRDQAYLQAGIDEYLKRIKPYAKLRLIEVPDETITPSRTRQQIIEAEAARILPLLDPRPGEPNKYVIALSERGQLFSSETFATELAKRAAGGGNPLNGGIPGSGGGPIIIIIGGALGLAQSVLDQANWVLSLSPLTFPHQLVRLIILEQLYRAFKIQLDEPYHK
jgi:23S rRNA (pseudouridine1915-N3)-methyltransferase